MNALAASEQLIDDTMTAARTVAGVDGALPERARVVVVGGGIIGASVLYHLALNGIADALLLERDRLTSGTTWHPAGLFATVRATHGLTELARHSADLYA
jgi:4-methylaminobutanoate oxidase (formaldehyde-forming)